RRSSSRSRRSSSRSRRSSSRSRRSSSRSRRSSRRSTSRSRSLSKRSIRNISTVGDLEDLVASNLPIAIPESLSRSLSPSRTDFHEAEIELGSDFDLNNLPENRIAELKQLNVLAKQNGFRMINVPLDGNCMFSVIGRAFNTSSSVIRQHTVDYLRRCKGSFDHIPANIDDPTINWNDYIDRLEEDACWGDNTALFAASLALNFQAHILQVAGGDEGSWIRFGVNETNMGRIVNMGYLDNFHYIALEPFSGRLDILSIPSTHSKCPPPEISNRRDEEIRRDEEVEDEVIGERIVREAEVIERELRQEEELTSIVPTKRSLRPSIPPKISTEHRRTPKLRPSVPRPSSIRQSQPNVAALARLETLTKIKDIIDALQRPLENKLSTLTNTEKAIMQCIGVA
ncbi:hypothetical protein IIV6-T1_232, partial [Invertebrate iridescent virus 6]